MGTPRGCLVGHVADRLGEPDGIIADERYVLGVPCITTMRDLEAPLPAYPGRGRRPKAPWQSVTQWRHCLDAEAWTRLTVRDGEKGLAIETVKRRVQTRIERKLTGPEEWLVVTRRPLSDDWTFEPHASRDATDQDARDRYHGFDPPPTREPMRRMGRDEAVNHGGNFQAP